MKKVSVIMTAALLGGLILAGCATSGGGKPEDAVGKQANAFAAGIKAEDIDGVTKLFSENFKHYEWNNKAGAKEFLANAKDMGYLKNLESDLSKMKITVEGQTAKAYPIVLSGSFGQVTIELDMAKESAGWMIVGLDASGI